MITWNYRIVWKLFVLDMNTWNHRIVCKLFVLDMNTWNHRIVCKLLVLDINTWNYRIVCKLFVLDMNTWNHRIVRKLFVLDMNTWNHRIMCKLFVLDMNTWNHRIVCKSFIFDSNPHHQVTLTARISWLFLSIRPNHPSLPVGPPNYIQCPHRADEVLTEHPTITHPYLGVQRRMSHKFVLAFPPMSLMSCSFHLHGFWDG